MTESKAQTRRVAIACGGTGGHLFPGLAVADELLSRGCKVTVLVSPKEVDEQGLRGATGVDVVTLPAVGLVLGRMLGFWRGFRDSYRRVRLEFTARPPQAVLAMGGFTSAPPILAARRLSVATFLHESNTIPGRSNRWLSWVVNAAFVGFPCAAGHLHTRQVRVTGTPVRRLNTQDAAACRGALGLDPTRPVVLVMGGSQGATAINDLVAKVLCLAAESALGCQWVHLSGSADREKVERAYAAAKLRAVVQSFCSRMDLALGAATVAISRAGASSLAELAAVQLPAILVPYPAATDNHQYFNARAFEEIGAAVLMPQIAATPHALHEAIRQLLDDQNKRGAMRRALARAHRPQAAQEIAEAVLAGVGSQSRQAASQPLPLSGLQPDCERSSNEDLNSRRRRRLPEIASAGSAAG
ncbi:MAG TPA: UDP-N-acetylglucosamine--N-acetylmuramyl-(pentapeptide) pyrophosphoryl-undecaprenol N-acetylglucosamine transferase [Verrucomicrobiae bacterium]